MDELEESLAANQRNLEEFTNELEAEKASFANHAAYKAALRGKPKILCWDKIVLFM